MDQIQKEIQKEVGIKKEKNKAFPTALLLASLGASVAGITGSGCTKDNPLAPEVFNGDENAGATNVMDPGQNDPAYLTHQQAISNFYEIAKKNYPTAKMTNLQIVQQIPGRGNVSFRACITVPGQDIHFIYMTNGLVVDGQLRSRSYCKDLLESLTVPIYNILTNTIDSTATPDGIKRQLGSRLIVKSIDILKLADSGQMSLDGLILAIETSPVKEQNNFKELNKNYSARQQSYHKQYSSNMKNAARGAGRRYC